MSSIQPITNEQYLSYIEKELMTGGGRWIATFQIAIRDFVINQLFEKKKNIIQNHVFSSLIYGGVRHSGFIISRAFSFMASPTYSVACATYALDNPKNVKWSAIIDIMRDVTNIKKEMEFEWIWILIYGDDSLNQRVIDRIQAHISKEIGLLYADLKNLEIYHCNGFIARHGAKLFHPNNLNRKPSRFKFLSR